MSIRCPPNPKYNRKASKPLETRDPFFLSSAETVGLGCQTAGECAALKHYLNSLGAAPPVKN
jgi:hypothetical protein